MTTKQIKLSVLPVVYAFASLMVSTVAFGSDPLDTRHPWVQFQEDPEPFIASQLNNLRGYSDAEIEAQRERVMRDTGNLLKSLPDAWYEGDNTPSSTKLIRRADGTLTTATPSIRTLRGVEFIDYLVDVGGGRGLGASYDPESGKYKIGVTGESIEIIE